MGKKLNHLQEDIINEALEGKENIVVEAVAGSGKTTTIIEIAKRHPGPGILLAFNTSIAKELAERLPPKDDALGFGMTVEAKGWEARTVHSVGFQVLRDSFPSIEVKPWKLSDIAKPMVAGYGFEWKRKRKATAEVVKVTKLMKMGLVDPDDEETLKEIMNHHGIFEKELCYDLVGRLLQESRRKFETHRIIDFDDQIWLPIVLNLPFPKYKKVLVDECQDLNKIQYEFSQRLLDEGGQSIYVGDRHQAIYGFAGADHRSFQNIIERSNAKLMPLSICYRCGKNIIAHAQEIVSHIEAFAGAPDGQVCDISAEDVGILAKEGDMVLCRLNAPLLSGCVSALKQGKRARIKGVDFAKQLVDILKEVGGNGEYKPESLKDFIDAWGQSEIRKLIEKEASESAMDRIRDLQLAMQYCVDLFPGAKTVERLCGNIMKMFSDEDADYLWFSTVHKAKGLEAPAVFIIEPGTLPLKRKGQRAWELEQEMNLLYVAITRAERTLAYAQRSDDFEGYSVEFFKSEIYQRLCKELGITPVEGLRRLDIKNRRVKHLRDIFA
jgi:DNA helicase II / ATP-dependent DNA helicase PcrA